MRKQVDWLALRKGQSVIVKYANDYEVEARIVFVNYSNEQFLTVNFVGGRYLKTISLFEIRNQEIKFYLV